jgi:hypothetical protein
VNSPWRSPSRNKTSALSPQRRALRFEPAAGAVTAVAHGAIIEGAGAATKPARQPFADHSRLPRTADGGNLASGLAFIERMSAKIWGRQMAISCRRTALLALVILAPVDASSAATVADTAAKWGLLGSWKLDCGAPASTGDVRDTYVVRGGMVFLDRDWGKGTDSSSVLSAAIAADNSIAIVIKFESLLQTRENVFVKSGDRKRALNNRLADSNDYSVRNGVFVGNGAPTPWMTHCR